MPPTKAQPAAASTRQRILDEAERLIAVKGVFGFTLKDVAGPLGIEVPAIYKHYRSRDDVMIEVSRRFIGMLSTQFELKGNLAPVDSLRNGLDRFVELMVDHPAYVRLALVDFATPGGGMDYVKLAAGGSFKDNFVGGPLASMHGRLRRLLNAAARSGAFREVDASEFYGLIKAALLIRLVFPDDSLLVRRTTPGEMRATKRWLWDLASRHLAMAAGRQDARTRTRAPAKSRAKGPLRAARPNRPVV